MPRSRLDLRFYRARWTARPASCPRAFSGRRVWRLAVFALVCGLAGAPSAESADSKAQMQSLDEQVQEIKSDVLGIAAELSRLEEKLLYPSNTQVAVFVAFEGGDGFRLDSVRVHIDGELVSHHVYSFKELEALQRGGVQRIYTGNVPTGDHQLEVTVAGLLSGGGEVTGTQSFGFRKETDPELLGVTLVPQASAAPRIDLGGW